MPEEFGPWKTVDNQYDLWNGNGTLNQIRDRLRGIVHRRTTNRLRTVVHQRIDCASRTVCRRRRKAVGKKDPDEPEDHALGRSREGFSTKIHLLCDAAGHRLIGWLKECRRVFSRFEKTTINFAGMIKIAFIERYLKLATR